jgi:hypothetical protein
MPTIFKSYSGTPTGIGPIAEIGPGGAHAGRVVGLVPALHLLSDVGAPITGAAIAARQKTKDFNDAEGFDIKGVSRGGTVTGGGPPRGSGPMWTPPPRPGPQGGPRGGGPAGSTQDLTDAYTAAHAKRAGRENRGVYRRFMGTPTRRPMGEQPFGPEDFGTSPPPPKKPPDTSDLRDWTA